MNHKKTLLAATTLIIFSSGCKSTKEIDDIYAVHDVKSVDTNDVAVIEERVSHIVKFKFDEYELPFDAAEIVEPHARYLIQYPNKKAVLQGNASSEGPPQYNYELGFKRAEAVKKLFLELGVNPDQLVTLSIGERYSKFHPNRSVLISY